MALKLMDDASMNRALWCAVLALLATVPAPPARAAGAADTLRAPSLQRNRSLGDFDKMFERRSIRVLVPYSRTLFFIEKGRERGMSAELARDFEVYLNQKHRKKLKGRPITIVIIPTTRGRLLGDLANGLGDVVAANLTVTSTRQRSADFVSPPHLSYFRELLVTGPSSPPIATRLDLSGKTLHLRPSSSYYESAMKLNGLFARAGQPPMRIEPLPEALEDEDVLEMVNAGVLDFAVVDSWKLKIWKQILPRIVVHEHIVLRDSSSNGWAIRHGSPKLQAEISGFFKTYASENAIAYRRAQLEKRVKQISDNTRGKPMERFERTIGLFQKYGQKYDFDPLMLVAQGFQESRLEQTAKSRSGAVGVMQLMPATGREMKVGNIHNLEPNIHAGAKYMDRIMTTYFADAHFSEHDRTLFAFASYNAGPTRIAKLRAQAEKDGLDPNVWFDNVEMEAAKLIGLETTTYVRNIFKYYSAYKLTLEAQAEARRAKQTVPAR